MSAFGGESETGGRSGPGMAGGDGAGGGCTVTLSKGTSTSGSSCDSSRATVKSAGGVLGRWESSGIGSLNSEIGSVVWPFVEGC